MFRKVVVPTTLKLSGLRNFGSLTKATRVLQPNLSLYRNQKIASSLFNQIKIAPYAFIHTESTAFSKAQALKVEEQEESFEPVIQKNKFSAVQAINANTQKALKKVFKYEDMSIVQDAVLSRLPSQSDMFVKAKTGTGKTLAFLIAAIETAIAGKTPKDLKYPDGASILVISPTRELANQIAEEADKLSTFYPFKVHCLVGGDSKRRQIANLERRRCDIVVATPGRLNDMLSSVPRFKKMCESLKVLVLDEADQLLDMGFKAELQRILKQIPEERQTMLFSATISDEIRENLGNFALSPNYELIDTVGEDDVNTNLQVKQSAVIAPYQNQLSIISHCLKTNEAANKGKVIVFLPTTKSTMVYANIFKQLLPDRNIYEIHSKKGQDQRSRIADRFRRSKENSILFTSDVSARGVDYPGVSLVLQVGAPSSREQYIHRLGRTGRAGRDGEGLIVLAPFEKPFLEKDISDLPVEKITPPLFDENEVQDTNSVAARSIRHMDDDIVREVYTAYLGYYSGRIATLGQRRTLALKEAEKFMNGLGIEELPHLSERFLAQLGLAESKNRNRSRSNSDYRSRERDNGFRPRSYTREDSFRPRGRDGDSFRPRERDGDSFRPRERDGGFRSREREGGFRSREREGGFRSRERDEGFRPRSFARDGDRRSDRGWSRRNGAE